MLEARTTSLKESFANANLPAVIAAAPIFGSGENASKVFQMTIKTRRDERRKPKVEYFEIFPGDKDNDVRVIDVNKKHRQVLLLVHEPRRRFMIANRDWRTGKERTVERFTQDFQRTYLAGLDQTHLFIAELPRRVSTVEAAHDVLKPDIAKRNTSTKRQGEWFFIPVTSDEERLIDAPDTTIEHVNAIPGKSRNQHVAEEIVKIDKVNSKEPDVFVRGKITHVDHKTIVLKRWCRVERNTERRTDTLRGIATLDYID